MNGGYQTLDLRNATTEDPVIIEGIYDIVKGSNGKAILVEDADGQEVFAQSKEVDYDYVITYISAEGKTVKVTITYEDVVTTVIVDDGAIIDEISARVDADTFKSRVTLNINNYSDSSHLWTVPKDGYIQIEPNTMGSDEYIGFNVKLLAGGFYPTILDYHSVDANVIYVKGGSKIYFDLRTMPYGKVYYYELDY